MAEALGQVHASLDRSLSVKKGVRRSEQLKRLAICIDPRPEPRRGRAREKIRGHVEEVIKVDATLDPANYNAPIASERFKKILLRLDTSSGPVPRTSWPG